MTEFANEGIRRLWAASALKLWPGRYWIVGFTPGQRQDALDLAGAAGEGYVSLIADHHEVSVILHNDIWKTAGQQLQPRQVFGPLCGLTFDVPLDIEVAGYLAPAVSALAAAGISIVPQCALIHDHLFVAEHDFDAACDVLATLRTRAQSAA